MKRVAACFRSFLIDRKLGQSVFFSLENTKGRNSLFGNGFVDRIVAIELELYWMMDHCELSLGLGLPLPNATWGAYLYCQSAVVQLSFRST